MPRRFGSIRPLGSGRFQAMYEHRAHGGRQTSRSFDTREEAQEWLEHERCRLTLGDVRDARVGRIRLDDFYECWVAGRLLAPRTRELYDGLWKRYVSRSLGAVPVNELSPTAVRTWHSRLTKSGRPGPVTVAKSYRLLATVMNDAVRDRLVDRTPCTIRGAGIERTSEMRTVTPAQIGSLADAIVPHFRALVLVAAYGGLRWGELAGLALRSVDLHSGVVTVERALIEMTSGVMSFGPPKSAAGRRAVHLPHAVTSTLAEHIRARMIYEPSGLVFTTLTGRPLRRAGFTKPWRSATTAAGVAGVRFHDLRHTAATLATTHGATVREVQARLGHSTPHAALRYQHACDERDRLIADRLPVHAEGSGCSVGTNFR